MSQIDLSNAPKGQLILHADDGRLYRLLGVDYWQLLEPAPAEKWTGEGLPPVGIPVEYQLRGASNGEWYPTQINFLSGQHVIYCDNDGDEVRNNPSEVKFRPIRTPEQIAAEERKFAVQK